MTDNGHENGKVLEAITESELLARLKCNLVPATDVDGKPIPEFAGLYFKPISVADSVAAYEYVTTHGKKGGSAFRFVRAVVRADGSRVLSDDAIPAIMESLAGPIADAIKRIRQISGEDIHDEESGQKKIPSPQTPA